MTDVDLGSSPERTLFTALGNDALESHLVGDARSPGKVHDAVHSAFKTTRRL